MSRIALIEDHARLASLIRAALGQAGIECDVFDRMASAWPAVRETPYAACVIDRGLPDGDGLQLVRRLRNANRPLPCLMLTARDALRDRVEGLDAGADDYLVKPFPMPELVARARALLRRPAHLHSASPEWRDLRVEPDAGEIHCGERRARLSSSELQIILSLVRAGGKTVRRAALETAAWGMCEAVTPNALEVALHRLRKKLLALGSTLEVSNTRGQGYALAARSEER